MISPRPPIPGEVVIDVSHWEGIIRWREVVASGITKAAIKLTDGRNFGDPLGAYNARAARDHGVRPIFYHYHRAAIGATEQMAVFAAALYGVRFDISTEGVVLDCESSAGLIPSRLKAAILAAYKRVLAEVQAIPEIYTRMSFWKTCVGVIPWAALDLPVPPLWAADYGRWGTGAGITGPRWLAGSGWTVWRRWQYTDRGAVSGIDAACDLNVES